MPDSAHQLIKAFGVWEQGELPVPPSPKFDTANVMEFRNA